MIGGFFAGTQFLENRQSSCSSQILSFLSIFTGFHVQPHLFQVLPKKPSQMSYLLFPPLMVNQCCECAKQVLLSLCACLYMKFKIYMDYRVSIPFFLPFFLFRKISSRISIWPHREVCRCTPRSCALCLLEL